MCKITKFDGWSSNNPLLKNVKVQSDINKYVIVKSAVTDFYLCFYMQLGENSQDYKVMTILFAVQIFADKL